MTVKIEIECDDLFEVTQHLAAIRAEIKKQNKVPMFSHLMNKVPPHRTVLTDNNCYGTHRAVFHNNKS